VLSNIKSFYQRIIIYGVPGFVLLLIVVTYLTAGVFVLFEVIFYLVTIAVASLMCMTSLVGTYGIIKHSKKEVLASGGGIMFTFIFTRIIIGDFVSSIQQIEILILFFVSFICFLEFSMISIYFSSSMEKITTKETEEIVYNRLNKVFNKNLLFISIVLGICYFASLLILQFNDPLISITSGKFMDINLESIYGIWLLIIMFVLCTLFYWFLIPKEKTKKV